MKAIRSFHRRRICEPSDRCDLASLQACSEIQYGVSSQPSQCCWDIGLKLLANFNSVVFDFVLRQKIQGQNIKLVHRRTAPVVPPAAMPHVWTQIRRRNCPRSRPRTQLHGARSGSLRARQGMSMPMATLQPFIWDEERRLHLRAKLDALYFILSASSIPPNGAPGRIRTSDPQIRSLVLYPAELRARGRLRHRGWRWGTQPPLPG